MASVERSSVPSEPETTEKPFGVVRQLLRQSVRVQACTLNCETSKLSLRKAVGIRPETRQRC